MIGPVEERKPPNPDRSLSAAFIREEKVHDFIEDTQQKDFDPNKTKTINWLR